MLSPGLRLGPYEILAPLGAGGMGEVFRARDTRLGRQVAVKILPEVVAGDARRVTRFETEARALAALSHPNILGIHDFGQSDGRLYAVTELLDGETLRERMSGEPLAWRKAAETSAEIADGLASAHAAGIVHRDLKPENVFITSDGRVKILDFGLAKVVEPVSEEAVTLTSPAGGAVSVDGQVVGTLLYMAPEQLRGRRVDGRTDIFALGCVLFEMLSAKRPFTGATQADTISVILHGEPLALESAAGAIPPGLKRIVRRCLEKRPEDRFDTAHDLALALRSISEDQEPAVVVVSRVPPASPARRWIAGTFIASAALAGLLVLPKWPRTPVETAARENDWGPPRQITSAPGWEAEPAFSPDGTLVAYSAGASGNADIWVVDPDGGEPLRLTDGPAENRKPTWFPDGRSLAFVSTRAGAASAWKVSRLGGSPSLLVEQADTPAISPDGTRIAFTRRGPSGSPRIWVAPLADLSHAERLTGDEDGHWGHMDPAWSPDGMLVCYSAFRDLWLVSAGGGRARKLTHDGKADREPDFSPDGKFVFFSSLRSNPQSVWKVALSGGAPERIEPGTGTANHPSLSRDGRRLVFSSLAADRDVVVADRKTGTVCRIASSRDDETPAIAPDGSAVAYVSNRLGTYDLWLDSLEAGHTGKRPPRRLTSLDPGPATPVFSPDGHWIAFFRVVGGQRDIWAAPVSGGAPVPLVESPAQDIHPAYAPDSARLAFVSDRSGQDHVWILPLRTGLPAGEPWRLTDGEMADMYPVWSPDGGRIAFLRGEEVWAVEVQPGAAPRRITVGAEAHHLAWESDGAALLVTGLFRTTALHPRRVELASGTTGLLKPHLVLGDRDGMGYISLSRDGRFLATDITEMKGNLWITVASRDGR
ncbi:MAG TPA: protein kinase [Thermoanaerobaculia bacterium]|nr:protein kinase [Thermoanaerobaculia bacterium]